MVDPRVLHSVTVEMATGFLLLAGIGVALKLATDLWLRHFAGRYWILDRWSRSIGAFAEPTSFLALTVGVFASFATSWTGLNVWPASMLWTDPTVRNKMLLVALSTTLFLGAWVLRARFKTRIWLTPTTGALFALLVLAGDGFLVLQNSVGGHLQGTGSLLDDLLKMVNLDETILWTFPAQASIACLIGFPIVVGLLGLRLRASNRLWARRELVPIAGEVKGLLAEALRADLGVDGPRRIIGRANFAVRKGHYARAVRLLEKAKAGLVTAPPFTGNVEAIQFWADVDPAEMGGPAFLAGSATPGILEAAHRPRPLGDSRTTGDPAHGERAGSTNLPAAMGLVEGSIRRFEEAPLLQLQEELRAARDALLDYKARGWDLTEPVRMLKAAHGHLQRAEWNDAIRCMEQFRREMRRAAEADSVTPRRHGDSSPSAPSADEM
jgi:hypothetical protein